MPITPQILVDKLGPIYSLPTLYNRLDQAINDPFNNLEDIAKILSEDSALSARLLRLANSALYSFPSRIDTITRAITIIGTQQLRDLVLATSVIHLFKGVPQEAMSMDDFWRHNIAVGIAARIIATYHREPNVERFYLMGLLHDIGRLVMLIQIPNFMRKLLEESQQQPKLLYRSEFDLLGFDHAEVGRLLLKRWKLPATMEQVIGYHHHPNRATQFPVETAIVHFSDILINAMQLGFSGERYVPPLHDAAWQILKLPPALLTDIMDHIEQQYTDAVAIFLG